MSKETKGEVLFPGHYSWGGEEWSLCQERVTLIHTFFGFVLHGANFKHSLSRTPHCIGVLDSSKEVMCQIAWNDVKVFENREELILALRKRLVYCLLKCDGMRSLNGVLISQDI